MHSGVAFRAPKERAEAAQPNRALSPFAFGMTFTGLANWVLILAIQQSPLCEDALRAGSLAALAFVLVGKLGLASVAVRQSLPTDSGGPAEQRPSGQVFDQPAHPPAT